MPARIIICDDDQDMVHLLAQALSGHGYEVRWTLDCESVWDLLNDAPADVVLMDLVVPRMGGRVAAETLRREFGASLKIIMISGESALQQTALAVGADGALQKPFKIAHLVQLIEQI